MALGWDDLERLKRVDARASALGFEFIGGDTHWVPKVDFSSIYVKPKDDLLPIYSRDATFFMGSIESIESWLDGIEWARHYDEVLKLTSDKKRATKEQQVRNQQLMKTIKQGELVQGTNEYTKARMTNGDEYDAKFDDLPF